MLDDKRCLRMVQMTVFMIMVDDNGAPMIGQ